MFSPVEWPSPEQVKSMGGQYATGSQTRVFSPTLPYSIAPSCTTAGGGHLPISSEVRHARDTFVTDLKSQLQSNSDQLENLKRENQQKSIKINELEKSIANFWNPELKKERLARKEENNKYLTLKDQHRLTVEENNKLRETVSIMTSELNSLKAQLALVASKNKDGYFSPHTGMGPGDHPVLSGLNETAQIEALKNENDQKSKEVYLLKKTLEELELRIETQKQTLSAKDQSIQKLLEMLQAKGFLNNDALESTRSIPNAGNMAHAANMENVIADLKSQINEKNLEIYRLQAKLVDQNPGQSDLELRLKSPPPNSGELPTAQAIRQLLHSKDERILTLEKQLDHARATSSMSVAGNQRGLAGILADGPVAGGEGSNETYKEHVNYLKTKLDQIRIESSNKESELLAIQSKNEMLMKQNNDLSQHINVLKEALFSKEQQSLSLQSENDSLRGKVEEKDMLLQRVKSGGSGNKNRSSGSAPDAMVNEMKDEQILDMKKIIEDLRSQVDRLTAQSQMQAMTSSTQNDLQSAFGQQERMIEQMRLENEKQKTMRGNQVDMYTRLHEDVNSKNQELNRNNEIKSRVVKEHEEKISSLLTANMKKDSAIKTLEISLAQKTEELVEFEQRLRKLQEEKILLLREKQELSKQVEALEEQVNHCIDEMTKIQSALDQSTEVVRDLEGEKRIHERRVGELENVAASLKTKLSEMRHLKNDEHVMQQRLLSEARKREGEVIQDAAELQEILTEKDKRISELEQALNETARMTAAREAVLSRHNYVTNSAHKKVDELVMEVDRLQKALRTSDSKLTIMANQLNENEAKMQQMQSERKKQLADVMQMKHDALAAALGEKNAHIALLENSGAQTPATARDLKKLHVEKEQLVRKLNEQNQKRMTLLQSLNSKVKKPSSAQGSKAGSRAPSVIEEEPEGEAEAGEAGGEEGIWA